MRQLPLIFIAVAGSLVASEPTPCPLWDGSESVAEYAKKVNLPATQTLDLGNGIKMEMVLIPAGKFMMGMPEPATVDEEGFHLLVNHWPNEYDLFMPQQPKLNILLITTDQQRGDSLGVTGNPVIRTPCLDALARDRNGLCFTNAYAEAPACVPQRTAWLTGRHPLSCRQNQWREIPCTTSETVSGVLAAQGWYCGVFGKRHFTPIREPYGFHEMKIYESGRHPVEEDDYLMYLRDQTEWGGYSRAHSVGNNDIFAAASILPEREYPSSWVARESAGFLERHTRERAGQPFFLWTSFNKPHSPYDPPQPYDRLYRPQQMPRPHLPQGGLAAEIAPIQHVARHYTWDTMGVEQMLTSRAYYYGLISHIDDCIQRVIATLDRLGLRDNTLIAFTSDHGDMMGDHHLFFKAQYLEGSARVPYLWWIPEVCRKAQGVSAAGTITAPVGVSGVTPTLLDLAGADKAPSMDADSLLPLLRGEADPAKCEVAAAYSGYQFDRHSAMLRWDRWKYIYWQLGDIRQLFDLPNDPGELHNLAEDASHRALADEAHRRLEERLAQYPAGRDEVLDRDGKLTGGPFVVPETYQPPIRGPWGRRPG